jgi:hypothetical protein
MKLKDIRIKTGYDPKAPESTKSALRNWLFAQADQYPYALTLTLEQTIAIQNPNGTAVRRLNREDCEAIAKRFMHKLNRGIYGHAAKRHNKALKCFAVVEGERSSKRLHLHMALGRLPSHVKFNEFEGYIAKAKMLVESIDEQHKLDIADRGWLEYITKEVGTKDTDNVLWLLA